MGARGGRDQAVQTVEFTGGRLSGIEEKAFTFHVDQLPSDAARLTFKALQTYSSGEVVSWIEVAADGAAEPEHPAPVLELGPPRGALQLSTAGLTSAVTLVASVPASDTAATDTVTRAPLAAGAVGGLAVAAGGWALWRRRRAPGDAS